MTSTALCTGIIVECYDRMCQARLNNVANNNKFHGFFVIDFATKFYSNARTAYCSYTVLNTEKYFDIAICSDTSFSSSSIPTPFN